MSPTAATLPPATVAAPTGLAFTVTATRDVIVPLVPRVWFVRNTCTGGSIRVIGASGTGITIATVKAAIVSCDGTNVNRITADA